MKKTTLALWIIWFGALIQVGAIAMDFNPVVLCVGMLYFYIGLAGLIFSDEEING
jgi:hypothetical protein